MGQINFHGISCVSILKTNNSAGHTDVFVIKLDSNANLIWCTSIASNSFEHVLDMEAKVVSIVLL